jgi:hypothetical protein
VRSLLALISCLLHFPWPHPLEIPTTFNLPVISYLEILALVTITYQCMALYTTNSSLNRFFHLRIFLR